MALFSKQFFSSSLDNTMYCGIPIDLKTSGTFPSADQYGTGIHTPPSGSTEIDEVWIYGTNTNTASKTVVIQFGATGSEYEIVQELPSRSGLTLLVPGLIIGKTGSLPPQTHPEGAQIAGYVGGTSDATTSGVALSGYVNRISGSV
jgi:hypothetical protein